MEITSGTPAKTDVVCGNRLRYGIGDTCVREAGHRGPHRQTVTQEIWTTRWFDAEGIPAAPEKTAELTVPSTPEQIEETRETDAHGQRIVTVKGKRYVIGRHITQPKTTPEGRVWPGSVNYWTERDGEAFGPTRVALDNSRPGTVGAAIWAEATR